MADRKTLLGNLVVGDIFHAEAPNGASSICLVLSVNETAIQARRVTTQENLNFDRQTRVEQATDEQALAVIKSVAPLPAEIQNVFLKLDQKYGVLMAMDEKARFADLKRLKLTDAEKKALLFVGPHYAASPLPALAS
jgi:hypothetical protein